MAAIRHGVRRMTTLAGQALKDAIAAEEKHARGKKRTNIFFSEILLIMKTCIFIHYVIIN